MYQVFCLTAQKEAEAYEHHTLLDALAQAKFLRECGNRFVTIVSENPDVVGKPGVDSVVDGKLPDGSDYTWKKRRI